MASLKKKIQLVQQRIQKLQLQLAGARQQQIEPDELAALEKELATAQSQLKKLRGDS
jgi:predicted  nucleic acid-binding Zn-ribbon protein